MEPKQISPVSRDSRLITSHCFGFRPISKEQMELSRQKEQLEKQIGHLEAQREKCWNEKDVIIIDDNLIDDESETKIGANIHVIKVQEQFDQLIAVAKTMELSRKKKYNKRPKDWREIARHFIYYKNLEKTIVEHGLLEINPNIMSWSSALYRWSKQLNGKKQNKESRRESPIGQELDDFLTKIVEKYNNNGIPMTNFIIREILKKEIQIRKRTDLEERMNKSDSRNTPGSKWYLDFGNSWCQRFYKRNKISTRVGNISPDSFDCY